MTTLATGKMTLGEAVKREDPNGQQAQMVDVLSEVNSILQDAPFQECNNGTFHQATRIASEPTGQDRIYNEGVSASLGVTDMVTEPTQLLDDRASIDSALLLHQPSPPQFRIDEEDIHIRGISKTLASRVFDGDRATNPKQITGINNRSDYNLVSSSYVYDNALGNASATANKTSLYIIQWGPRKVTMLHPRNVPGGDTFGLARTDLGEDLITDPRVSTKAFLGVQTYFSVQFGLFIYDPRMIKRIVNISTTSIDGVDDFSWDEEVMFEAVGDLEDNGEGAVIYVNKTLWTQMRKRANEKGNATFTMSEEGEGPFAKKVMFFDTIPIHRVDQITNTQSTVN